MPSSYKSYAVDFNRDGHINLWDPEDAIGSVISLLPGKRLDYPGMRLLFVVAARHSVSNTVLKTVIQYNLLLPQV